MHIGIESLNHPPKNEEESLSVCGAGAGSFERPPLGGAGVGGTKDVSGGEMKIDRVL